MKVVHTADVPRVRAAVRDQLRHLEIGRSEIELVSLLLTELVSNAMRHGLPPVTARTSCRDGSIRVEVCDSNDARPEVLETTPEAIGGRGMKLVASLATAWGWEEILSGKCVWFEISLAGQRLERAPA